MNVMQNVEVKKKNKAKSIFKKLMLTLLVLVLLIVTATVMLYVYTRNAKTTIDDISAIVSSKPMPAAERYSFDASSLKMEMRLNKQDIWYLLKEVGIEETLGDINNDLKNNGFTLKSYGMDITDKGILISAELNYGDFLRLPLKLLTNASVNNGTITLSLSQVYLGSIKLPLGILPLDRLASGFGMGSDFSLTEYKYDVNKSDLDLLKMLTSISFEDKRMVMAFKLDESLFGHAESFSGRFVDWFADECPDCIGVLREYSEGGSLGEKFKELVKGFSTNPEKFSDFIAETLAVCSESVSEEYMYRNKQWLAYFMPDITSKRIADLHDSLYNICSERYTLFDNLLDNLQASYNSRKLGIDKRGVTYNNKPFELSSYLGDNWAKYSGWLDASSFRPVLVGTSNASKERAPVLRKITDSRDYIDNLDSLDKKLPMGFIVRMKDGTPVLKYNMDIDLGGGSTTISNETVVLDNAQYESMMKNPLVPVWKN